MNEIKTKTENSIHLSSITDLEGLDFIISNYQRGYKWGKKEVLELLNDINSYNSEQGFYCLQPLIIIPNNQSTRLKRMGGYSVNISNEVVDGQQRLTTIYLILNYLRSNHDLNKYDSYTINYKTRTRSKLFLIESLSLLHSVNISTLDQDLQSEKYNVYTEINELWNTFVSSHEEYDNVDVYHFFVVYTIIRKWFEKCEQEELTTFIDKLFNHVKFIWYELNASDDIELRSEDIVKVFLNNNKNKISLTSSELIKALFILQIKTQHNKEIAELETNRFALEWDIIENQLQDKSFWYFVCNNYRDYEEGTHIDFLFDIINKRPDKIDNLYSYRKYEEKFNDPDEELNWDEICELFYKLLDWYNDKKLYHYIGYLINTKIKSIYEINSLSLGVGISNKPLKKDDFLNQLTEVIKKEFLKKKKKENGDKEIFRYHLDNLDFQDLYKESLNVLLLFNVLHYVKNPSNTKFPFELYVQEKWSIEHINPQNPRELENIKDYEKWFLEKEYSESEKKHISSMLGEFSNIEDLKKNKSIYNELKQLEEKITYTPHKIGNLALLDRNTNSALGNKLFQDKRNKILLFDSQGKANDGKSTFIPLETKNVFTKSYSDLESSKDNRWNETDEEDYKNAIKNRLELFLPQNAN